MRIEVAQQRKICYLLMRNSNEIGNAIEADEEVECSDITVNQDGLDEHEISSGCVALTIENTGALNIYVIDTTGKVLDYEQA